MTSSSLLLPPSSHFDLIRSSDPAAISECVAAAAADDDAEDVNDVRVNYLYIQCGALASARVGNAGAEFFDGHLGVDRRN